MTVLAGFAVRRVDPDRDLPEVGRLLRACDLADVGAPDSMEAMVADTWRGAGLRGAWVVHDGADRTVGYLELESEDPASSFDSYCPIHPDHREGPLRRAALGFLVERATERAAASGAVLRTSGSAGEPGFADDAGAVGFRHVRVFWHLVRDLDPDEPAGDPPEGVTIRTARDPQDDRAIHAVLDASFRGHFGLEPMSFEAFVARVKDERYDPTLVAIAELDGRPVGVSAGWIVDDVGWVGDLGVLAEARGRGIGTALLHRSFATFASRGLTRARLNVDSDNATGATRLYEAAGMRLHRAFDVYETTLTGG